MTEETKDAGHSADYTVALQLSEKAIATVKHNLQLCEQLVSEVLEKDIDWGTIPGVPQPFLWDSGAAKIMSAFNCYAGYKVQDVFMRTPHIRYTITSQLISRDSHQIVATGIGAASTKEVKHRYRWVDDPEKEGISRKGLKQRRDGKYRILNPETEDLLNTIAKMAAKRADIDAAQSLPGVAATLRKLFSHPLSRRGERPTAQAGPEAGKATSSPDPEEKHNWSWFWAQLNTIGVTSGEAHEILNVASIKEDWVGVQHKTLQEAYEFIKAARQTVVSGKVTDQGELFGEDNGDG